METRAISSLTKEDISASFTAWKKEQNVIAKQRIIKLKKKTYRKKLRSQRAKKTNDSKKEQSSLKVEALPEEFLNELTADESSKKNPKGGPIRNDKIAESNKKKRKRKLKLTSSLIDNADYIPLDTNLSSTNFKIARLDRDNSNSMTQTALEFYNRRRHGKYIHRVPTKSLFTDSEKLEAKRNLGVK